MKETFSVSVTGHRDLFHDEKEIERKFLTFINKIKEENSDKEIVVNTGMAIGFDLLIAEICLKQGIKYNAILPFEDHLKNNEIFCLLKETANKVVVVSEGPYAKYKYFIRDVWLVDNANVLFAYLIKPGKSGTRLTVEEAIKKKKEVIYFWWKQFLNL